MRWAMAGLGLLGVVTLAACGDDESAAPCIDHRSQLVMLDESDGTVRWRTDVAWPALGVDIVGELAVTTDGGAVTVVSTADGSVEWTRDDIWIVGHTDEVAVVSGYATRPPVSVLDIEDGTSLWTRSLDVVTPVLVDDLVVGRVGDGEDVLALDLMTGEEMWRRAATPSTRLVGGGALLTIAAFREGTVPREKLTLLDTDDGEEIWSIEVRQGIGQATVIDGAVLISTGKDGKDLVAHALDSGDVMWTVSGLRADRPFMADDGDLVVDRTLNGQDRHTRRTILAARTGELLDQETVDGVLARLAPDQFSFHRVGHELLPTGRVDAVSSSDTALWMTELGEPPTGLARTNTGILVSTAHEMVSCS